MKLKTLFSVFTVALCLALLASSQFVYDSTTKEYRQEIKKSAVTFSEPLIPGLSALKLLSLGNPSALADILWLQTIQYFGSGNPYGTYATLGPLLNTITKLDPKFEYAYEFGLVVLPFMKQADMAITLGERAQIELPGNGLLSYYLATDYHLNKKDYRKAAFYYEKAANEPGSPTAAKRLAGISLAQLSDTLADRIVAMEFWKTVYEKASDPVEKERAALWFAHMQLVLELEQKAQEYQKTTGRFPASQEELIAAKLLPEVQKSPIRRLLTFDQTTGRLSFDKLDPNAEQ